MRIRLIALLLGLAAAATLVAQSRPAELLLEAARKKLVVDGDRAGGIRIYEEVVSKYASDHAAVAQALIRLGELYDAVGDARARSFFDRVARDYGDQSPAGRARAWLASHPSDRFSKERLGAPPPNLWAGVRSRDGEVTSVVDSNDGRDLAVRDLATDVQRMLTTGGRLGRAAQLADRFGSAEPVIKSRDGGLVAYTLYGADPDDPNARRAALHIDNVDGSHLRHVRDLPRLTSCFLFDWSPDGRLLAAVVDWTIATLSTGDGTVTPLVTIPNHQFPSVGRFSPDGKWLAYGLNRDPDTGTDGGVFLIATDGTTRRTLVSGPARFGMPFWAPDGKHIVFTSDRSGSNDLWQTSAGAEPIELVRLQAEVNINIIDLTSAGALYYSERRSSSDAYIATLDPVALSASQPVRVSNQQVGTDQSPAISPDNHQVAFLRARAGTPGGPIYEVVVQTLATRQERVLTTLRQPPYRGETLQWFPDSQSLLIHEWFERRNRFRRVSIDAKDEPMDAPQRSLFEGPWGLDGTAVWTSTLSPDGTTLFYSLQEEDGATLRLVRRNLATGSEEALYREVNRGSPGFYGLSVSPDRQTLVFALNGTGEDERALFTLPVTGGVPRRIHDFQGRDTDWIVPEGNMTWTPDSQTIVFHGQCGSEVNQLCAIPAVGGKLQSLGLRLPVRQGQAISSDGKRVAFSTSSSSNELWVMRNLLPSK